MPTCECQCVNDFLRHILEGAENISHIFRSSDSDEIEQIFRFLTRHDLYEYDLTIHGDSESVEFSCFYNTEI